MDKILIKGIPLRCRIGVSSRERARQQLIEADVELVFDLRPAGVSDDLAQTIDYVQLHAALADTAASKPYHLIEALAQAMAHRLLDSFPAERVVLRVKKPGALAAQGASYAAVEVTRERDA